MDMCPVIFLNGPPYCGKDTLAGHIVQRLSGFKIVKFAAVLKERTHALYGRPDLPHDHFELCKDEPNALFLGLTPRDAYIAVSEKLMKPIHGKAVFGKLLVNTMLAEPVMPRAFVISDSGFAHEAFPVIERFGFENCILARIHAEKRGCTFEKDSRSYITLPIKTIDVENNGEQDTFTADATHELANILQVIMMKQAA